MLGCMTAWTALNPQSPPNKAWPPENTYVLVRSDRDRDLIDVAKWQRDGEIGEWWVSGEDYHDDIPDWETLEWAPIPE